VGLFKNVEARKAEERKLAQALEAAESASAAKTRFLANTSHEIRTPLNGVIGVAGALALTDLDARQREMVDLILGSGRSLERILTDILDLSKVEAGKMELELRPFDLRTEINASAQLMSMRADDKGVGFTIDYSDTADGVFLGDAVRIRQIVSNLVSNAVKFTEAGQVSVTVDVVEAGEPGAAAWLSIAVQDSGMGFEQGDAPFLFDRFAQADDSITRRYGGTGLGLSICKALAELMGGEISAASTPGEGSRFQVDLPLARAEAPAPVERSASTVGLGGEAVRVLLVEDHPTNQKVVELLLAPFGVDLTIAENGVEALSLFGEAPFDLILMDMQMPVMDGLAATAAIRRREAAEGRVPIPICMMTANSSSEHRAQAAAAGADSFMSKPVSSQTLLGGIDDMLALAAARRGG
jgi:CheY-like chemotaxis protein